MKRTNLLWTLLMTAVLLFAAVFLPTPAQASDAAITAVAADTGQTTDIVQSSEDQIAKETSQTDGVQAPTDTEPADGIDQQAADDQEQVTDSANAPAPVKAPADDTKQADNPQDAVTAIYLNGQSGNDDNDGTTKDTAVLTFAKAKELAAENPVITAINVTGKTFIDGDISLQGTNAIVMRDPDFSGDLFSITYGKSASLSDITVDGNSENGTKVEGALLLVETSGGNV